MIFFDIMYYMHSDIAAAENISANVTIHIIYNKGSFVYMRNVKKSHAIFSLILAFAVFISPFGNIRASAAFIPEGTIYSEAVYMFNMDTDIAVYEKNAHEKLYPASTTKIVTAIVVLEKVQNLDEYVKIPQSVFDEFWLGDPNKSDPSAAAIEAGQTNLTYRDCLYALMLASACEAANILAYNVGDGSVQNFVNMMNELAGRLGCADTHFGNPHGLWEEDNYTSAYDLFLITKYGYDNYPEFMKICDTYEYDMPANKYNPDGYTIHHTNKLIASSSENPFYYEYAHGIKTGSIDYYWTADGEKHDGGRCLVSTASKNGYTYMLVTLQGPYYDSEGNRFQSAFTDHLTLYKWAFSSISYQLVLSKTEPVAQIAVEQGENADYVILRPERDYATLLPNSVDLTAIRQVPHLDAETILAPVQKGEVLGTVELLLNNETLAEIDLIASDSVKLSQIAHITAQIKELFDTTWFRLCFVLLILLIVVSVILISVNRNRRKKAEARARRRSGMNTKRRY